MDASTWQPKHGLVDVLLLSFVDLVVHTWSSEVFGLCSGIIVFDFLPLYSVGASSYV